ncbi:MAG: hypothetical protein H7831_13960 [Magnetococcus sp. WYHC-3]
MPRPARVVLNPSRRRPRYVRRVVVVLLLLAVALWLLSMLQGGEDKAVSALPSAGLDSGVAVSPEAPVPAGAAVMRYQPIIVPGGTP